MGQQPIEGKKREQGRNVGENLSSRSIGVLIRCNLERTNQVGNEAVQTPDDIFRIMIASAEILEADTALLRQVVLAKGLLDRLFLAGAEHFSKQIVIRIIDTVESSSEHLAEKFKHSQTRNVHKLFLQRERSSALVTLAIVRNNNLQTSGCIIVRYLIGLAFVDKRNFFHDFKILKLNNMDK